MDTAKKYKLRKLNLLDIRSMSRILRELKMTKEEFKELIKTITEGAKRTKETVKSIELVNGVPLEADTIEAEQDVSNISRYAEAILMAIDSVSFILAESESFWEFIASLLQLTVEDLNTVELFDFAEIIKEFFKDPQVESFFGSISKATRKTTAV